MRQFLASTPYFLKDKGRNKKNNMNDLNNHQETELFNGIY
jgi:hypothetical protein